MKRTILTLCLVMVAAIASAQYYRVTGNNVYVRKGAGTNFRPVQYTGAYGSEGSVQLNRGTIVRAKGAARNGFMPVQETDPAVVYWGSGWMSTKYLTPATRCRNCNGKGFFAWTCPECNGEGYHFCCDFVGRERCNKCYGIGWY